MNRGVGRSICRNAADRAYGWQFKRFDLNSKVRNLNFMIDSSFKTNIFLASRVCGFSYFDMSLTAKFCSCWSYDLLVILLFKL